MVEVISIDPGVKKSAIAFWDEDKKLIFADDLPNQEVFGLIEKMNPKRLYVETPILYPTKRKVHADVKNLLSVARSFLNMVQVNFSIAPSSWKGQVPKKIHAVRIVSVLGEDEIKAVKSIKNHNTIDAIGIGLFALRRLGRGGA